MEKIDITRIMVNNKYRFPLSKDDRAIYVVDIDKAGSEILKLINEKDKKIIKQEEVS